MSTWILNDCAETNERIICTQLSAFGEENGRKYVRWVQINMHILRYDVGNWNSLKFTEEGLLQQNMDTRERLVKQNPLRTTPHPHPTTHTSQGWP